MTDEELGRRLFDDMMDFGARVDPSGLGDAPHWHTLDEWVRGAYVYAAGKLRAAVRENTTRTGDAPPAPEGVRVECVPASAVVGG